MKGFASGPVHSGNCGTNHENAKYGMFSPNVRNAVQTDCKTHAVYSIPCGDREEEYLGQKKRQFCTCLRLRLHRTGRIWNWTNICLVSLVHTGLDEF